MEKEFIGYTDALDLKELGFDEPCFSYYKNNQLSEILEKVINSEIKNVNNEIDDYISAPLYQQAFRWFREKYKLRGFIGFRPNVKQFDCHIYDMSLSGKEYTEQRTMEEFNKDPKVGTYEEAELECLKKLIEIVKENGKFNI
jgi:hypothetical protein